jgi:hypothetical protein
MDLSPEELKRELGPIVAAARKMHSAQEDLRREGMEFLKLARDWVHIGDFEMARRALRNALSIFSAPPWPVLTGDEFCRPR